MSGGTNPTPLPAFVPFAGPNQSVIARCNQTVSKSHQLITATYEKSDAVRLLRRAAAGHIRCLLRITATPLYSLYCRASYFAKCGSSFEVWRLAFSPAQRVGCQGGILCSHGTCGGLNAKLQTPKNPRIKPRNIFRTIPIPTALVQLLITRSLALPRYMRLSIPNSPPSQSKLRCIAPNQE